MASRVRVSQVSGGVHSDKQVGGEAGKSSHWVRISKGCSQAWAHLQCCPGKGPISNRAPSEGEEAAQATPHSSPSHICFHCSPIPGYLNLPYRSRPCPQAAEASGSREWAARYQGTLTALTRAPAWTASSPPARMLVSKARTHQVPVTPVTGNILPPKHVRRDWH